MVLDSSDSTAHTAEHLEENTKFIFWDLSAVVKEESQASSISYTESGSFLNTSLINQEKKNNNSEAVKVQEAPYPFALTHFQYNQNVIVLSSTSL